MSSDRRTRRPLVRPADWPARLQSEWTAATAPTTSLFQPAKPSKTWSANSWRIAEEGLGKLLAVLQDHNLLPKDAGIAALVLEKHLVSMVSQMQEEGLTVQTQTTYLIGVSMAARGLLPKLDWRWIQVGIAELRRQISGHLLVSALDISTADLRQLGKQRFRAAWLAGADHDITQAVVARDGLMVSCLALRPLRRKTFAGLRLGEHILIEEDRLRIRIPAEEMKMGKRAYEADWPDALKEELFVYIKEIRPLLLKDSTGDVSVDLARGPLWISERGSALSADAIYRQVGKMTTQAFGSPLNLHRFRHIAASTVAMHEPELIYLAQDVLGHDDPKSKEFYIQANQLTAVRRSHAVEDGILREAAATTSA